MDFYNINRDAILKEHKNELIQVTTRVKLYNDTYRIIKKIYTVSDDLIKNLHEITSPKLQEEVESSGI